MKTRVVPIVCVLVAALSLFLGVGAASATSTLKPQTHVVYFSTAESAAMIAKAPPINGPAAKPAKPADTFQACVQSGWPTKKQWAHPGMHPGAYIFGTTSIKCWPNPVGAVTMCAAIQHWTGVTWLTDSDSPRCVSVTAPVPYESYWLVVSHYCPLDITWTYRTAFYAQARGFNGDPNWQYLQPPIGSTLPYPWFSVYQDNLTDGC